MLTISSVTFTFGIAINPWAFAMGFLGSNTIFGGAVSSTTFNTLTPFANAVFIIDEVDSPVDGTPQFMVTETDSNTFIIQEGTNTPQLSDVNYNALFKPHVELYWSDDGGITFNSADVREFSQLGVYSWRMRWYQLGCSRNRVYKLVCVSPAPIVVLGGVMEMERVSGGAN